jgi:hypothetical protein
MLKFYHKWFYSQFISDFELSGSGMIFSVTIPDVEWIQLKVLDPAPDPQPGFRIRIHFLRIRIRIQRIRMEANTDLDTDPDPDSIRIQGFNDQKF